MERERVRPMEGEKAKKATNRSECLRNLSAQVLTQNSCKESRTERQHGKA
jgi:hypothetical protein